LSGPQTELLEAILPILADPARRVYAVMDGARFDDLPLELAAQGIAHRSLYKNVQDIELVRVGPWLIDLYHGFDPSLNVWGGLPTDGGGLSPIAYDVSSAMKANAFETGPTPFHASGGRADPEVHIERIIALAGELSAAVFWIGYSNLTEAKLWRHLRTLNMVLIPRDYVEDVPAEFGANALPSGGNTPANAPTIVMFRHVDGNVLSQVLPVMDASQFSRFFGPANEVVFLAPDNPSQTSGSTVRRAALPEDAPPAKVGLLSLDGSQCEAIARARMQALKRRAILEFGAGEAAGRPSGREQVASAFDRAEAYGLESKEDVWAFVAMDQKFGREFERTERFSTVREHFEDTQLSAGAKLYLAGEELDGFSKG
jgi:hypothetical protein